VYGILIKDKKVLVSDEYIKGHQITKFPGGGLEFGEGSKDCIVREFKEELNLDVFVVKHFYTTDFFVHSAFDTNSQVISIYYMVDTKQPITFNVTEKVHDYVKKEGAQSMRWIDLKKISDNDLTLIIDKKVGEMLQKKFRK
jgi:ADP-ribose pyrophosphatase YjhB (NUDIX family)